MLKKAKTNAFQPVEQVFCSNECQAIGVIIAGRKL